MATDPAASTRKGALTANTVDLLLRTAFGHQMSVARFEGHCVGDRLAPIERAVVCYAPTVELLRRAAADNRTLVISREHPFYLHGGLIHAYTTEGLLREDPVASPVPTETDRDLIATEGLDGDPVVKAKREFIAKNGLVVFRLRDHWQAKKANETVAAFAEALGWSKYRLRSDDALYDIPAATAEATVNAIRGRLNLRAGLRAVGDRKATVRRVLLHPGVMPLDTMWQRYSEVDLVLTGEVREWENTFYAADIFTAGEKRSLVTVGRVVSEEPGMRLCTDWLKTIVPLPARWIGAGDPYWRPV